MTVKVRCHICNRVEEYNTIDDFMVHAISKNDKIIEVFYDGKTITAETPNGDIIIGTEEVDCDGRR